MISLHIATCVVSPIAAANAALNSSSRHLTHYVVVAGDSLSTISARYGLSVDELRQLNNASPNPINGERINVGQTIYVPTFTNSQLPELGNKDNVSKEGANKRGNSPRLTQSFHFSSLSRSFLP